MFSLAIKKLRIEKQLSQKQLANILGCDISVVSRWENNHQLPVRYIAKFKKHFGKNIFLDLMSKGFNI